MTRRRIAAAAFLLSALAAGTPAAFAHGWPGGTLVGEIEAVIPAGALPPGAATAQLASEGNRFRIRFEMPVVGPATLRFWKDYRSALPVGKQEVIVTSDRGGTFRAAVEPSQDPRRGPPLFLGGANGLAAFTAAFRASARGAKAIDVSDDQPDPDVAAPSPAAAKKADLINGIELEVLPDGLPLDCRRLAFARFVVAELPWNHSEQGLLDCAARGAGVLILLPEAKRATSGEAMSRLGIGPRAVPWGLGAVAWSPGLRSDVADTIAQLDATGQTNEYQYMLGSFAPFVDDGGDGAKPKGVPGSSLVLVLLALYVAVIGPIGYFVGVRPRRAWLAWSWFPLVAIGATIALTAVSTIWRGKPAELVVSRTWLLAPTGAGLENTEIRLQGSSSARYAVSVPWRDGDVRSIERGYRFGTPFARPAGTLALTDDRIAGRLDVDGLTVGRFGTAGVSWIQPVAKGGVQIVRRGDKFTIMNHMPRPIRRALIRGVTLCGQVDALPAGAERTVAAVDCERAKQPENAAKNPWHAAVVTRTESEKPTVGAVLIVAEVDEPPSVEARPKVQTRSNDILLVRGPLPGDEWGKP